MCRPGRLHSISEPPMSAANDLRLALRTLRRAPAFAAVSVLSVAVGIGANVVVFSVVNALLLRPLPVPGADRLVRVGRTTREGSFGPVSLPEYRELRSALAGTAELIGNYPNSAILTIRHDPRPLWLEVVSANYFAALGLRPLLGRGFGPDDDRAPNASPAVVISHALWRERFGAEPSAVGSTVRLNGHDFTVVGVAPPSFRGTFTGFDIDAWVPVMTQELAVPGAGSIRNREDRFLMLLARLRPGAAPDAARGVLAVAAARLRAAQRDTAERVLLEVRPAAGVHPFIAQIVATFLGLLQGVMLLVLLIACANLANVLLVRAWARRRELAVRQALGAGRWRLARLLLAESVAIAAAGGALGLALAAWTARALERIDLSVGIPVGLTLGIDARVTAAALAATFVTAVAFGAGPALAASRAEPMRDLRAGGATADRARARLRAVLVAAQVVVATVLLVGSSLLLQSLRRSRTADPGFDPGGVQLVSASPELLGYDEARGRALWEEVAARAERTPGVRSAALALFVPLGNRGDLLNLAPAERRAGAPRDLELLPYNIVSPGYFDALRIPLLAGRGFRPDDDARAPWTVVISASMARHFFGTDSPLGRSIRVADRDGRERLADVVGVVGDVKLRSLGEPPRPIAYFSFRQMYRPGLILHLRIAGGGPGTPGAGGSTAGATRAVVEQIRAVEPDLALEVESMTHATGFALIPLRVAGSVLGFAGLVGLFLASLGVFGLVAYAVAQRTREIGIRMALGAGRAAVTRLVVLQGMRPVAVGLALGLALALGAARLIRGLLVGVGPSDPATLALVATVLLASAAAAVLVPVRRAVAVDPALVLRAE